MNQLAKERMKVDKAKRGDLDGTTCAAPDVRRHPQDMVLRGWLVLGGQPAPDPREPQSQADSQDNRWETATHSWRRCAGDRKYGHKTKCLAGVRIGPRSD